MTCNNCDECTAWNPFPWIDGGKVSARKIRSELGWRDLTEAERDANLEYNMKEIECTPSKTLV